MLFQENVNAQKLNPYTEYYSGGVFGKGRTITHTWSQYDRNYYDAIKHGNEKYFYTSGKVMLDITWNMGEVKKSTYYYSDGSIMCINNRYNNGVLEGEQKWYSTDANNNKFLELNARMSKKQNKAGEYYSQVDFLEFFDGPNKKKAKYSEINNTREVIVYNGKQEEKLTESGGKLINAKTWSGEVKNGKLIKFEWNAVSSTRIVGDTLFVYSKDNDNDSSVFSYVNLSNWNVDFSTYESVRAKYDYQTYEFELSFEIPTAKKTSNDVKILVLKPYSSINNLNDAFLKIFSGNCLQRGWHRTYSRQTNKLKYEAFINESGVTEFEKWFDESGIINKHKNNSGTILYYPNGSVKEEIGQTIQKLFFPNGGIESEINLKDKSYKYYYLSGQIKLDSTTNESTSYYSNGKKSRYFSKGLFEYYDSIGNIIYKGRFDISLAEFNKIYQQNSEVAFNLARNIDTFILLPEYSGGLDQNYNHITKYPSLVFKSSKKTNNIGNAFKVLCQEQQNEIALLKSKHIEKLKHLKIQKNDPDMDKFIWYNETLSYLNTLISHYQKIEIIINKTEEIIKSENKKEINKKLKGVDNIIEIKKILGIE